MSGKGDRNRTQNHTQAEETLDEIFGKKKPMVCSVCGQRVYKSYLSKGEICCEKCYSPERSENVDPWTTHESDALGCNISQIPEMESVARKHGLDTKWDRQTGCCKVRSAKEQRKLCNLFGLRNKDSYY